MKLVNGRYSIKKTLNENNNFIVYEAQDLFDPQRDLVLKITASEEKFQRDLLTKEYLATAFYRHPLLRPIRSFHNLLSIDGRFTDSTRCFYVADKLPGLFRLDPDNGLLLANSLYALIAFLHTNGAYHGDLRESNALRDKKGNPVFFDMSPLYVNTDMGQRTDRSAFVRMMNEAGFSLAENDFVDFRLYFPHKEIIQDDIQKDIITAHAKRTKFPAAWILSERSSFLPDNWETLTAVYDYSSEENARIWYEGLIPIFQSKGYEYFGLEEESLSLPERIIKYLECHMDSNEEPAFKASEGIRSRAVHILENKIANGPAFLGLGPGNRLSKEDFKFMDYLAKRFKPDDLRIVTWSREPLNGMIPFSFENLNQEETAKVLKYYYYVVQDIEEVILELADQSRGEPVLTKKIMEKAAEDDCLRIEKGNGTFEQITECFHVRVNIDLKKGKGLSDIEELIALAWAMGGKIPLEFSEKDSVSLNKAMEYLLQKNIVYKDNLFYTFRLSQLMQENIKKVDDRLARYVLNRIARNGFKELPYLESYVYLALNTKYGEEAYDTAMELFERLGVREQSIHHDLFFNLFLQFHYAADSLSGVNLFSLYLKLYEMDSQRLVDRQLILTRMKKYADTPARKVVYKSHVLVVNDKKSDEVIDEVLHWMAKGPADHTEEWNTVFNNVLIFYIIRAEYARVEQLGKDFREEIEAMDENSRSLIMNEFFISYMDNQKSAEMQEASDKMLALAEKYRERLSLQVEFNAYNARAISCRRFKEYERALLFFDKALEIAQRLDDQRLIAIVSTNMGIIYVDQGQYESAVSSWIRAIRAAERIHFYHAATINSMNLAQAYKTQHLYDKAYDVTIKGFVYLKDEKGVREEAKMNYLLADILYELGDRPRAKESFKKAGKFYEKREFLRESVEYQNLALKIKTAEKGSASLKELIESIIKRYSRSEDKGHCHALMIQAAELSLIEGEAEIAGQFMDLAGKFDDAGIEMSEKNKADIIKAFLGDDEAGKRISKAPYYDSSQALLTLHWLVKTTEKGSALFYDYLLDLFAQMKEWVNTIPLEYRDPFIRGNKRWSFHRSLLKQYDIDPVTDFPEDFRESHREEALKKISEDKKEALLNYRLSPVNEGVQLYKTILIDLMDITEMTRGAFFEYDMYSGWSEQVVVQKEGRFHAPVPMRSDLLNEVLFEQAHRDIFYAQEDKKKGRNLSGILIIPILDIEKLGRSKNKTEENRQSSFHYFALKGCLYLDTTRLLLYPDKHIADDLGPFRDYINAAGYYDYLKQTALLDRLTGLYKREHWMSLTVNLLDYADNTDQQAIVGILDLDHFKNINDTYGHTRGDSVLKEMGRITKNTLRVTDLVGRYGGEEFCVAMMIPRDVNPHSIIDRIRINTENSALYQTYKLTCSIGYALYPDDGKTIEELIVQADEALYFAKNNGRNKTVYTKNVSIKPEKGKAQKIINDPVREGEKINAVFDIAQMVTPVHSPDHVMKEIFNLLVTYFHIQSLFIHIEGGQNPLFMGMTAEANEIFHEKSFFPFTEKEELIRNVRVSENFTLSVYLSMDSDQYSVKGDRPFFHLVGTLIAEKLFHSLLISGNLSLPVK